MQEREETRSENAPTSGEDNNRSSADNTIKGEDSTPIYLAGNTTLQTPEEARKDKSNEVGQSDKIDVSNTDLRESDSDRTAGSDRAGTAERKPQDM